LGEKMKKRTNFDHNAMLILKRVQQIDEIGLNLFRRTNLYAKKIWLGFWYNDDIIASKKTKAMINDDNIKAKITQEKAGLFDTMSEIKASKRATKEDFVSNESN
jgi:hypothetical protein